MGQSLFLNVEGLKTSLQINSNSAMSVKGICGPPALIRRDITLAGLIVFSLLEREYPLRGQ